MQGVGFRVEFLWRFLQNSFVYILATTTLHILAETITLLAQVGIRGLGLNLYDVRQDLDHLGIGEEALEELLFILGFHLAHQDVVEFVKVKLLFPDRFGIS